ncbi:MAG: hypothetical protein JWR54_828, partial [Mucilaginibacter sp.]|nr:hypothetical protein [Mucilaginibacter sp.]
MMQPIAFHTLVIIFASQKVSFKLYNERNTIQRSASGS